MTGPADESRAISDVGRVRAMPYGLARTQAAERLVRRFETSGPPQVLPYAIATVVDSMFWAGEVERSFVPFTRLLRLWDTNPEHFDQHDRRALFWMFTWMVANLMEYPQVPAAQIEATIEDMARRYALEGLGTNAVARQRFLWAQERGDDAATDAAFEAWRATPRDDYSQCEACKPGDQAAYLYTRGRHEEAARVVEQALAESARCATEPASMLSVLQLAYLALGRAEDAARAHRRAVAELERATGELAGARGYVVEFLARSGNDDAALRRIVADQRLLATCETPRARLDWLVRVGTALHLVRAGGGGDRTVPLAWPVRTQTDTAPVTAPSPAATGASPTVAELDDWVRAEATALAVAFDERNGSDAASRLVTAAWSAQRSGHVVDLTVVRPEALVGTDADAAGAHAEAQDPVGTDVAVEGAPGAGEAPGEPDGLEALLERAEKAEDDEDWVLAADLYVRASRLEQADGLLRDAGWSVARAARCAWRSSDPVGATGTYLVALQMLDAADTPPELLVPVLADHAACAAEAGTPGAALPAVDVHAARLEELLAQEDPTDVEPHLAERTRLGRRRARLALAVLRARLLATTGGLAAAAEVAGATAVALAEAGAVGEAAHAFWLAGRVHRDLGDLAAAAWHLESAVEGMALYPDRRARADAASELIAVLRAAGRDEEADAVEL